MSPATQKSLSFRQVFAIPAVRRLWFGQFVSITGDFLAIFAVISIASFRMHGTPAQITGVSIAYMLPLAIFGPIAGVFVDRWNVKYTMIASDLIRSVMALLLVFAGSLEAIWAILFAISMVSTFFIPAQSVTIRAIVPREGLLATNALMQQAMLVTRIASPAAAGALVARFGASSCFYLDTVSFLFSAFMLSAIVVHRPQSPPGQAGERRGIKAVNADLFAGVRFVLTHPPISFVMIAMATATFAISCFSPLIAVFVRDILHAQVRTFGTISAMIGVGMVVGSLSVRRFAMKRSHQHTVLAGLGVMSAGIVLMGGTSLAVATGAGAFVMGLGVGFMMVPAQTIMQSETPVPMVGRVASSVMALISVAQVLGLLLSGSLADFLGMRPLFYASATLIALLTTAGYFKLKRPLVEASSS